MRRLDQRLDGIGLGIGKAQPQLVFQIAERRAAIERAAGGIGDQQAFGARGIARCGLRPAYRSGPAASPARRAAPSLPRICNSSLQKLASGAGCQRYRAAGRVLALMPLCAPEAPARLAAARSVAASRSCKRGNAASREQQPPAISSKSTRPQISLRPQRRGGGAASGASMGVVLHHGLLACLSDRAGTLGTCARPRPAMPDRAARLQLATAAQPPPAAAAMRGASAAMRDARARRSRALSHCAANAARLRRNGAARPRRRVSKCGQLVPAWAAARWHRPRASAIVTPGGGVSVTAFAPGQAQQAPVAGLQLRRAPPAGRLRRRPQRSSPAARAAAAVVSPTA